MDRRVMGRNPWLTMTALLCGPLMALLASAHVAAATLMVATTGTDSGLCTASPCHTITYAVSQAAEGDTISIAAGTYSEHDITIAKSLTLTGAGAATTLVDAGSLGRGFAITNSTANVNITALTIQNGRANLDNGGGILNTGTLILTNAVVTANVATEIQSTTLTNPNDGSMKGEGGGIFNGGTLILVGTSVTNNRAGSLIAPPDPHAPSGGRGGGIANAKSLRVQNNSTITGNRAAQAGTQSLAGDSGGILNAGTSGATLVVSYSTISNNTADNDGGAIGEGGFTGSNKRYSGDITLDHVTAAGNQTFSNILDTGNGFYYTEMTLTIASSTFTGNSTNVVYGGSVIAGGTGCVLTMTDTTVTQNTARASAVVFSTPANLAVNHPAFLIARSVIASNTLGDWAVFAAQATGSVTDTQITGNSGGGMQSTSTSLGPVSISYSVISGNIRNNDSNGVYPGAGLSLPTGGTLSIMDTTISDNHAVHQGGGIYIYGDARITLTNSTISGNSAPTGGGILFYSDLGPQIVGPPPNLLTIINSTISGNTGGAIRSIPVGGTFHLPTAIGLTNTTVAGNDTGITLDTYTQGFTLTNTLLQNTGANCSRPATSQGYNLDSGATCGLTGTGDLSNTNPNIGPLANNGGPTFTHALNPGSPAINRIPASGGCNGAGLTTDQRGIARPQGGTCDVGAFEFYVNAVPSPQPSGPPAGSNPNPAPPAQPSGAPAGSNPNPLPAGRQSGASAGGAASSNGPAPAPAHR